jgi:hypothetical protein
MYKARLVARGFV